MELFIYIYLFLVGITLGSFYNVVGLRLPKGESIVTPRSHCTTCDRTLHATELIPVFSYLFQRGKCKGCKTKISALYPTMELLTGLLFAYSYYHFGFTAELVVALLLISLLVIIVVSDLSSMLILNKVLLFFLPLFVILRFTIAPLEPIWDAPLGAAVGFGLLFLLAIVSKGGMGGGDIKLYGVIGFALGLMGTLTSLFIAAMLGLVVAVINLAFKSFDRKREIPFGPYIAVGALIAYFFGQQLVDSYRALFFF
ncbi:prepilin peptidase [Paenalkalicoccus suaedae]|uniref:Prepilin peptidase n=1 Tax=Paenalkalicoccus suaedae TaxID=2592382 RepID=A0A859FI34_9BACI|nr:A24 family peptidase [Paenalkalicoccus suaedae]QKS71856.1 prepilin peptidase [Paenalkalicoccus suaedae]